MIPPLVSMSLAKTHLRIINNDLDNEIDLKVRLASQIVANHCKLTAVPDDWLSADPATPDSESDDLISSIETDVSPQDTMFMRVPGNLQVAVLLVLSDIFYNGDASTSELLSDTVKDLLTPFRDPTFA